MKFPYLRGILGTMPSRRSRMGQQKKLISTVQPGALDFPGNVKPSRRVDSSSSTMLALKASGTLH